MNDLIRWHRVACKCEGNGLCIHCQTANKLEADAREIHRLIDLNAIMKTALSLCECRYCRQVREGNAISKDNARQNDYWQRVGGHPPPGYQDTD